MAVSFPNSKTARPLLMDMTLYQWTVLLAAWLGWGFDVFDSLLFNFVAPNCVPQLLGLTAGTPAAAKATLQWVGILTSLLLVGWGIGGIIFGRIADRIGRTKTLLLTMLLYSVGTAACALAPNMAVLTFFRFIASLGIGGEWAAGAAMVAEVVPEKRRVEAGVLLYTAAPVGILIAMQTDKIVAALFPPQSSWRIVFACGLLPTIIALLVRIWVKEPERWKTVASNQNEAGNIAQLFAPQYRRLTLAGLAMATIVLLSWWSCNAFLPAVATELAKTQAHQAHLDAAATKALISSFKTHALGYFAFGGLLGVLATIPTAKLLGRKPMFGIYYALGALTVFATYGLNWPPETRLSLLFLSGVTIFGIFGAFTFYLPELFPTRLRGTGAGFCYNAGRFLTAIGPFLVGAVASKGDLAFVLRVLMFTGVFPLIGLILLPFIQETRGTTLED